MNDDVFEKYYKRVARRGWVKSSFIGLTVGFICMLVTALILFFVEAESLFYVAIIVFAVVSLVSVFLLYFLKYKPSRKDVANAVDALGMEERFVTMLELEGSKSSIARLQRADTLNSSSSVPSKAIRVTVSTLLLCLLVIFGALALGATTYTALVYADVAPGFGEVVDALASEDETPVYEVHYEEYGDGFINGEQIQFVEEGGKCTTVYAEAMPDSMFYMWSDGVTNPMRTDTNVQEDMTIYAIFVYTLDMDGEGEDGGEGEQAGDGSPGDSSAMGEEGAEGDDGSDGDGEGDGDSDSKNDSSERNPGTSGGIGSGTEPNNKIYDNEVNGDDEKDSSREQASEDLKDADLTDEQRKAIEDYLGGW